MESAVALVALNQPTSNQQKLCLPFKQVAEGMKGVFDQAIEDFCSQEHGASFVRDIGGGSLAAKCDKSSGSRDRYCVNFKLQ
mmetsp:Transcript_83907/g.242373  ORF Transcript_83907/g.242373 Transcript_83907/m.242373 type:complete len:82 (-) Transcript_83907:81-326(-)